MKIAHLSDIHFYHTHWSLKSLFSKSLLGTLNHACNPHRKALDFDVFDLPNVLKFLEVDWVFISGDWTTTSNKLEYRDAKAFLEALEKKGLKVLSIPGNHDHYTSRAHKQKRFYRYIKAPDSLKKERYAIQKLNEHYALLMLDTTLATPLWSSQGYFPEELELKLRSFLKTVHPKTKLVVMNHFPVLPNDRPKRHQMIRKERLRELLEEFKQIKVYLHGHTHCSEFSLCQNPVHINCGSLTLTPNGSFHIMDLTEEFLDVKVYHFESKQWEIKAKKIFPMQTVTPIVS